MSTEAIIYLQRRGVILKDDHLEHYNFFDNQEDEARQILNLVGFDITVNRNELWVRLDTTEEGRGLFSYNPLRKNETLLLFYFFKKFHKRDFEEKYLLLTKDEIYQDHSFLYDESNTDEKKARKKLDSDLNKLADTKVIKVDDESVMVSPLISAKLFLEDLEHYKALISNEVGRPEDVYEH